MRIAIVEDNIPLADGIAKAFSADGHGIDQIHDGEDAISFLKHKPVDLVILDVNLPSINGLDILKELRRAGNHVPILLLTARSSLSDKITGLDLGADDYLAKPFDLAELKARARALLRRQEKQLTDTVLIGNIEFNLSNKSMTIDDQIIELPRREFALAEMLLTRSGHVFSKTQILEHLYGTGADIDENAIELYIHRLRKKLIGSNGQIKTIRGLGYCYQLLTL